MSADPHLPQEVRSTHVHYFESGTLPIDNNASESNGSGFVLHQPVLSAALSPSANTSLESRYPSPTVVNHASRLSPKSMSGHHSAHGASALDGSDRLRLTSAPDRMSDHALSTTIPTHGPAVSAPLSPAIRPPPEISVTSLHNVTATGSHDQMRHAPQRRHSSMMGSPRRGSSTWSISASDDARGSALATRRAIMASNGALGSGQQQREHYGSRVGTSGGFKSEMSLSSQHSMHQQRSQKSHPPAEHQTFGDERTRPPVQGIDSIPPPSPPQFGESSPLFHANAPLNHPPNALLPSPNRPMQQTQPAVTQLVTAFPDLSSSVHLAKVQNVGSVSNHALRPSRLWLLIDAVSPETKTRAWSILDMSVVAIHVWNLLFIPLTLAWPCMLAQREWMALGHILDLVLLLNAGLQSKRVYFDNYGIRITNPIDIRRDYFRRRGGWLEMLGSVPIEVLVVLATPKFFRFAQGLPCGGLEIGATYLSYRTERQPREVFYWSLLRLSRFLAMVPTLIAWQEKPIPRLSVYISRLVKNFLFFLIVAHFDACIMWVLCYQLDTPDAWINTFGLGIDSEHGVIRDFKTQYVTSFLEAQQVMFFAFRHVQLYAERSFCVIEVIVGALVNGSIFGNISNLLQSMQKTAAFDKKLEKEIFRMDYLRKYMRGRGFPPELQKRIRKHNEFEWTRLQGMTEEKLFGDLPNYLQQEVCNWLHLDSLNSMPLFKNCHDDAFKGAIAATMDTVIVQEGFFVYRQGDSGNEACFIREGSVEFVAEDGTVTGHASKGQYFGEAALFESAYQRPNSVRAVTVTELGILSRPGFDAALVNFPRVAQYVQRAMDEARARERKNATQAATQAPMEKTLKVGSPSRKLSTMSTKSKMGPSHPSPDVNKASRKASAVSSVLVGPEKHRRNSGNKRNGSAKDMLSGNRPDRVTSSRESASADVSESGPGVETGEKGTKRAQHTSYSNNRRSSSRGNEGDAMKHDGEVAMRSSPHESQNRFRRSTSAGSSAAPEETRNMNGSPSVLATLSRSRQGSGSGRPDMMEGYELEFGIKVGTLGRRGA